MWGKGELPEYWFEVMFPLPCGKDVTEKNGDIVIASNTPKRKKLCIKKNQTKPLHYMVSTFYWCLYVLKFHIIITRVFCSVSHGTSEAPIQQCLASVRTMSSADGLSDGWKVLAPSHRAEV